MTFSITGASGKGSVNYEDELSRTGCRWAAVAVARPTDGCLMRWRWESFMADFWIIVVRITRAPAKALFWMTDPIANVALAKAKKRVQRLRALTQAARGRES